jgi:hypothetical protein
MEEFAARNDDDIESSGWFVMSEQLPRQTLRAVSNDGAANLSRRRNAQPSMSLCVLPDKHRHKLPVHLGAALIGLFEVGAPPNVLGRAEYGCWQATPHPRR